jgi:hypothetical protein
MRRAKAGPCVRMTSARGGAPDVSAFWYSLLSRTSTTTRARTCAHACVSRQPGSNVLTKMQAPRRSLSARIAEALARVFTLWKAHHPVRGRRVERTCHCGPAESTGAPCRVRGQENDSWLLIVIVTGARQTGLHRRRVMQGRFREAEPKGRTLPRDCATDCAHDEKSTTCTCHD